MNSQEFVIWLKGFTEGVHDFNITPKQWDLMKEKLAEVNDNKFVETPGMFQVHPQPAYPRVPLGPYGTGTPNHDLVDRHPWGAHKVWGGPIDSSTTSGYLSASHITTGTATYPIPGATITYTTSGGPTWYTINKIENDSGNK